MENALKQAHSFSSRHRKELESDKVCGCFYCLKTFNPKEIEDWCDNEDTALCPYCGIDSVIGGNSGYPITEEFLKEMHHYRF